MIAIDRIDHIVLTVLRRRAHARLLLARAGHGAGHLRGRPARASPSGARSSTCTRPGASSSPRRSSPRPGAIDLCLITETPLERGRSRT